MTAFPLDTMHEVPFLACGPMCQPGVIMHAVSIRLGGGSESPYASLNLGFGTGDSCACVLQNRARFGQAVGFDLDDLVTLRQVHGNRVIVLTEAGDLPLVRGTPGDGLSTNRSHLPLAVITQDCF